MEIRFILDEIQISYNEFLIKTILRKKYVLQSLGQSIKCKVYNHAKLTVVQTHCLILHQINEHLYSYYYSKTCL